jgi:hypothetical protein
LRVPLAASSALTAVLLSLSLLGPPGLGSAGEPPAPPSPPALPAPPPPPFLLGLPGEGAAFLRWTAPLGADAGLVLTGFDVLRDAALVATVAPHVRFLDDRPLANGQAYVYRVTPRYGDAAGPSSNEASVTPADGAAAVHEAARVDRLLAIGADALANAWASALDTLGDHSESILDGELLEADPDDALPASLRHGAAGSPCLAADAGPTETVGLQASAACFRAIFDCPAPLDVDLLELLGGGAPGALPCAAGAEPPACQDDPAQRCLRRNPGWEPDGATRAALLELEALLPLLPARLAEMDDPARGEALRLLVPATAQDAEGCDANVDYNVINVATDPQFGTAGADMIIGTSGDDTIYGLGGDDCLVGKLGNDVLHGQDGNDILVGDAGDDTGHGGFGDDDLHGNQGSDKLYGEEGHDELRGDEDWFSAEDFLDGGRGDDYLNGDGDDDTLHGGPGSDFMRGEAGHDTMHGDGEGDTMFGEAGRDGVFGGGGDDALWGESGDDGIEGGPGTDTIRGGTGGDSIRGTDAAGSPGDAWDWIDAGMGNDAVWNAGDGGDWVSLHSGRDYVHAGNHDDVVYGGGGRDELYGDCGDDTLHGGAATDWLIGGAWNADCGSADVADTGGGWHNHCQGIESTYGSCHGH